MTSLLRRLSEALDALADAISDQSCRECGEYPEAGRHEPADECPGLFDGSGCSRPQDHHPWQARHWWIKPDYREVVLP